MDILSKPLCNVIVDEYFDSFVPGLCYANSIESYKYECKWNYELNSWDIKYSLYNDTACNAIDPVFYKRYINKNNDTNDSHVFEGDEDLYGICGANDCYALLKLHENNGDQNCRKGQYITNKYIVANTCLFDSESGHYISFECNGTDYFKHNVYANPECTNLTTEHYISNNACFNDIYYEIHQCIMESTCSSNLNDSTDNTQYANLSDFAIDAELGGQYNFTGGSYTMNDDLFIVKPYMIIDCQQDEYVVINTTNISKILMNNLNVSNVIISLLYDLNEIIEMQNNCAYITGQITSIQSFNATNPHIVWVYYDSSALILPRLFKSVNITLDKVPVIQINRDYIKKRNHSVFDNANFTVNGTLNRNDTSQLSVTRIGDVSGYCPPDLNNVVNNSKNNSNSRRRLIDCTDPTKCVASPSFKWSFPPVEVDIIESPKVTVSYQYAVDFTVHVEILQDAPGLSIFDLLHFLFYIDGNSTETIKYTFEVEGAEEEIDITEVPIGPPIILPIGPIPLPFIQFYWEFKMGINMEVTSGNIAGEPNKLTVTQVKKTKFKYGIECWKGKRVIWIIGRALPDCNVIAQSKDISADPVYDLKKLICDAKLTVTPYIGVDLIAEIIPLFSRVLLEARLGIEFTAEIDEQHEKCGCKEGETDITFVAALKFWLTPKITIGSEIKFFDENTEPEEEKWYSFTIDFTEQTKDLLTWIGPNITTCIPIPFFGKLCCNPTSSVTVDPTTDPTRSPSTDPTRSPSTDPTISPTADPTTESTQETEFSTYSPSSREPTTIPTLEPTNIPTLEPTNIPTLEPTNVPTLEPTNSTTLEPTNSTTLEPTQETTNILPTPSPSNNPSSTPSNDPSSAPSNNPSVSDKTTEFPTYSPSSVTTRAPTNNATLKPTELTEETTTILPTPSPIMCDCKGGNYLDLILVIDLTAKLSINECNTYKQGIAELFASIKGEYTFPRVGVIAYDNKRNVQWIVHLNDSKYNDLTSKTPKIGLIAKKEYYDTIRNIQCNINDINDIAAETDTYSAIISAIKEHTNSYNQREKKIVLFSTRSNNGNDVCDVLLMDHIHNIDRIEFIIFNIGIDNGNIDINQYLKCLTKDDSSKLFGLPPPIDINKFYGVTSAFQREICHERYEDPKIERECGCDNQNYQITFDSIYHRDLTTKMSNDDCNGAHSNCDYSSKCYTYSVKQIEPFIFNKDCNNDKLSYIILSPKDNCKLKMDHFDYLKILHRIFDTQTGHDIVDIDIIYNDNIDKLTKVNGIKIPIKFNDENSLSFKFTICLYGVTQFVTTNIGFGYHHQFGYHCHSTYLPDICQNDNAFYAQSWNIFNNNNNMLILTTIIFCIMILMNILFMCNSSCMKNKNNFYHPVNIKQYDVENYDMEIQNDDNVPIYQ